MKLEKAKEIIQLNLKEADKKMPPDVRDALIILSEAASTIISSRKYNLPVPLSLLPGETEK